MLFDGSDRHNLATMSVSRDSTRDGDTTRVEWHRDGSATRYQ
jgi:hypothetical protein